MSTFWNYLIYFYFSKEYVIKTRTALIIVIVMIG